MGRDLQKRKRRSSRQPVRIINTGKKLLNPRGNVLIAQNWDKKETLAQNYRRLGLVSRLGTPAGGTEKKLHDLSARKKKRNQDPFAIATTEQAVVGEVRVERDAEGKIVRVIRDTDNPLKDPLAAMDSDSEEGDGWGGIEDEEGESEVIRGLKEAARNPAPKRKRFLSEAEREWLGRLVERHGDDLEAMARDARLNPMQQNAGDLKKRLQRM